VSWSILCGDCLDVMPTLRAAHFDVAVCDPPYIIGGSSIAEPKSKAGTWADMVNAATWYTAWLDAVAGRLRPEGWCLVFGNWRSLPTYICAAARSALLSPRSCMVWDKQWIGAGGPHQLRPRWELVLWLGMPEAAVEDRGAADVAPFKWHGNMATSGHPAEKPVGLIRDSLLRVAAPRGGAVLDPFAGRGSVGLAALQLGMSYVGIEDNPEHADKARAALAGVATQMVISAEGPLFEAAS
jgi:site-specific DNA-methyltransferase (adenine-specific)